MWAPFALSVGLALVGVVVNLGMAIASPKTSMEEAYVVADRVPIVVEADELGAARTIVATQSYVGGQWWSQLSAFDAKSTAIVWQSERIAVPYAKGMRACRFGRLVALGDEQGNVSALNVRDGHVLWRSSIHAELATCCSTESSLVSGTPGDLILTTVGQKSFLVGPASEPRGIERTASCHPLAGDCKGCEAEGVQRFGAEDRFIIPGAYVWTSYSIADHPDWRLLFGSGVSGGAPAFGLQRSGKLVWQATVSNPNGMAAGSTGEVAVSAANIAVAYHPNDARWRVALFELESGRRLWETELAASADHAVSGLAISDAGVMVNQDDAVTVLGRVDGIALQVLGGRPASPKPPPGSGPFRAARGILGALVWLGLGAGVLLSAVRHLDHTRLYVRPAALVAGTVSILSEPARVHMMFLQFASMPPRLMRAMSTASEAVGVLMLVVATCAVTVVPRLSDPERPLLPRLYGTERAWRSLLAPLAVGVLLSVFSTLVPRGLGMVPPDPYAALANLVADPLSPKLRTFAVDLPASMSGAISGTLIAWGVAFPWLRRKFADRGRFGPWTAVVIMALALALSGSGTITGESWLVVAVSFLSATVVGALTQTRSLEDGIAAQIGFSAAGVLLLGLLRVTA